MKFSVVNLVAGRKSLC